MRDRYYVVVEVKVDRSGAGHEFKENRQLKVVHKNCSEEEAYLYLCEAAVQIGGRDAKARAW